MAAGLTVAHTADLDRGVLAAVRALLDAAFDGAFGDDDWEHCLGGLHAIVRDGGAVVAHGAVVQRRLQHGGRALRAGWVEGVAVDASARRRGHAGTVMTALERVVRGAYDLGALCATDLAVPVYEARGWVPWRGPTAALGPDGPVPTPGELVHVLPGAAPLDLDGPLACDWRDGDLW